MAKYIHNNDAFAEVDNLFKKNTHFVQSMQEIAETAKQVSSTSKSSEIRKNNGSGMRREEISKVASIIREYDKKVNISKFFEERLSLAHDFDLAFKEYVRDKTLYKERTFADLVKTGPKNEHEAVILMSATAFLEPHELESIVRGDRGQSTSIKDVCKIIDQSLLKRMTDQISNNLGKEQIEKHYEKKQEGEDIGIDFLGRKFGILDAITASINKIGQDAENQEVVQKKRGLSK